jgi:AcrR family transcriptional regulator
MARSEAARTALLDAAERLFAEHGIAPVSDRRVAEAAGNSNHSAVGYYFEGRPGLLRALITRHAAPLEARRLDAFEGSDSLLGDVRSLVIPHVDLLASLPQPSWRARFLHRAAHDPSVEDLMRESARSVTVVAHSVVARLDHLDREVVAGRVRLTAHMVSTACAEVETRAQQDGQEPRWAAVGNFLADAIAGMLQAPITRNGM